MWNSRPPQILRFMSFGLALLAAIPASGEDSWSATGKPPGWISGSTNNPLIYDIITSGPELFASSYDKIYRSSDSGETWIELNTRFDSYRINDLLAWQGMIYAATPTGIYRSLDSGNTWNKTGAELQSQYVSTLTSGQGYLFAMGDSLAWSSSDSGRTWGALQTNKGMGLRGIYLIDDVLYAATTMDFYRSLDGGRTWTLTSSPSNTRSPLLYVPFGGKIFATTLGSLVVSSNQGASWSNVNLSSSPWVVSLQSAGTVLYAGTYANGVYRSDRNGTNWIASGLPEGRIDAMAILGDRLFASLMQGTTANWMSWTRLPDGASAISNSQPKHPDLHLHRDALGTWILELEMAHSTGARIVQIGPSGQRHQLLWSGRMEVGKNRIPMTSLSHRHGATLIVVQMEDGRTLSIPAIALP